MGRKTLLHIGLALVWYLPTELFTIRQTRNKKPHMKPNKASWLMLAALLLAHAVTCAGEMTLFSHQHFGGREITVREAIPDLREAGFNDKASSMVVRSGRWEVCIDADFHGECKVFERGEYRTLAHLNNRITSAREVGSARIGANWRLTAGNKGWIELFAQPGFKGNHTAVLRDSPDLVQLGFNDRAASVVVEDGNWQLCTDHDYKGSCRTLAPGRYDNLGPLAGKVSSLRIVEPDQQFEAPPQTDQQANVLLFQEESMRGRSLAIRGDAVDFAALQFNDMAASLVIKSGTWEFCVDSRYRGTCRILGAGVYRTLDPVLLRAISSARQVAPQGGPGRPEGEVELFSKPEFGGARLPLYRAVPHLAEFDFSERAGSIIVHTGQWEFCRVKEYGGQCLVVGPGRYAHLGSLHNAIISLRRLR